MTVAMRDTLKAMREKLGEAHALAAPWRRAGLCSPKEWVYAWVGASDPEGVRIAAEEFEASFGRPFPEDLDLLWTELNGIAIHARSGIPDAPACLQVEPRALPDPILWPARGRGDPLQIADGDLHPTGNLYVVGELRGRGMIALAVPDDEDDRSCEVVWVEPTLTERPVRIAASLRELLDRWLRADFLLQDVLVKAGVKLQK
ncbi:MAG TPA: hypothetical protein VFA20_20270 [Myxococcaceae bacterium]|nr:hypothetical protein [Myxococcaceae bacterium]